MELTDRELELILSLVRMRLKQEQKRPSRIKDGLDIQALKVAELTALQQTLEEMKLSL